MCVASKVCKITMIWNCGSSIFLNSKLLVWSLLATWHFLTKFNSSMNTSVINRAYLLFSINYCKNWIASSKIIWPYCVQSKSNSAEMEIISKTFRGPFEERQDHFSICSWLVVPLSAFNQVFVWNITENIVQWRWQTIFAIVQNRRVFSLLWQNLKWQNILFLTFPACF